MDTPAVSELYPRSMRVTWFPPSPPNGLITKYTLYLHPSFASDLLSSSVPSTTMEHNPTSDLNRSSSSSTEDGYLYPRHNLGTSSTFTTPRSGHTSTSTSKPGITEENPLVSTYIRNQSQGNGSISFQSTEPGTIPSVISNPSISLSNPGNNSTSLMSEYFIKQEPHHRSISSSSSAASSSDPAAQSVTVSGNTTSYSFVDLLPYHTYNLQVRCVTFAILLKHYIKQVDQELQLKIILFFTNDWGLLNNSMIMTQKC